MTEHRTEDPVAERAGGPLPVTAWLAGEADVPVPRQPPARCRYRDLLREVIDPELGVNIVDLGLVYDVRVSDGVARVRMTMTTPGCPLGAYLDDAVRGCLWGAPGVDQVDVRIVWDPPWHPDMMSDAAKVQLGWRR
jgi:metal-sulfur cluster biosynthetic enzyme